MNENIFDIKSTPLPYIFLNTFSSKIKSINLFNKQLFQANWLLDEIYTNVDPKVFFLLFSYNYSNKSGAVANFQLCDYNGKIIKIVRSVGDNYSTNSSEIYLVQQVNTNPAPAGVDTLLTVAGVRVELV